MENHQPSVLITDDDIKMRDILGEILELNGFHVYKATDYLETWKILDNNSIDVVLLDLVLPRKSGLDVLKEIMEKQSHIPVIMISGRATFSKAVEATRLGAYDFLEKPLDAERVIVTLKNALEKSRLAREIANLKKESFSRYQMFGQSPAMQHVFELIELAAPTTGRVLITGESGTGKELVAQAIHKLSTRSHKPLIRINCASVHEELIESELFGHCRGAFTGAIEDKIGVFQRANGATLFLDEIGDMSQRMQAKVLRALESGEVQRVGSNKVENVDVRVLAATNKDLQTAIESGRFREDLYYRLNVVTIHLPPLRERKEDIPLLTNHFITLLCAQNNLVTKELADDAMAVLMEYDWPGNVRELRNFIERLVIMAKSSIIQADVVRKMLKSFSTEDKLAWSKNYHSAKEQWERDFLLRSLSENNWNISQTATTIGIDRAYLYKRMKKLKIGRAEES